MGILSILGQRGIGQQSQQAQQAQQFPRDQNEWNTTLSDFDPTGSFARAEYWGNEMPSRMESLSPYINIGGNAVSNLQGSYQNLLNDPGALMNRMGGSFKASPGYQYNVDQATRAANNAAAASGFIGSPQHQEQLAKEIGGMASQDYNQYLNNAMGLYGRGLQTAQGLGQMGYGAAGQRTQSLMDMLRMQAQQAQNRAQMAQQKQLTNAQGIMQGSQFGQSLAEQKAARESELAYANQANQYQRGSGFGNAVGGAMSGAMAGSFLGPLGAIGGGLLGGLGGMFG